ncbi:MAG: glycosyltransferase [Phycisphaerales bacterium]|nr:MAG: glycosyltransferase [Phycisphaerales bacterium]
MSQMDLSIIIPAYEESKKIAADVKAAAAFLQTNHFAGEIIVVDDGSSDNTTQAAEAAARLISSEVSLNVIRNDEHRGKGYAVRTGMAQSKGEYVMFADSGSCVPYENTLDGLKLLKSGGCDIANGSRKMQGCDIQRGQSWHRRMFSRLFRLFIVHVIGVPAEFTDTQCGFKVYRGEVARQLYGRCITDGFSFDVEVILRARKAGYRIKEFPVTWTCDPDSRLSAARSLGPVLRELIAVKRAVARD